MEFVFDMSGSMCGTKMKQVTGTLGSFVAFDLESSESRVLEQWFPDSGLTAIPSPFDLIDLGLP